MLSNFVKSWPIFEIFALKFQGENFLRHSVDWAGKNHSRIAQPSPLNSRAVKQVWNVT